MAGLVGTGPPWQTCHGFSTLDGGGALDGFGALDGRGAHDGGASCTAPGTGWMAGALSSTGGALVGKSALEDGARRNRSD